LAQFFSGNCRQSRRFAEIEERKWAKNEINSKLKNPEKVSKARATSKQ